MSNKKSPKRNDQFTVTAEGQVTNTEGEIITNNPQPGRHKWIKLWVDPWLDGTTRYVNSGSERAFFVDLLTLAGRSRFPGVVCPGQERGQLIGYPLSWYQAHQPDLDILGTFEKFRAQGKIAYTITCENPLMVVVEILNWRRYQSDLDAAAKYSRDYRARRKQDKDTSGVRQTASDDKIRDRQTTEGEQEQEKEKEKEQEQEEEEALRAKVSAASAEINEAFDGLFAHNNHPFGSFAFQLEWLATVHGDDLLRRFPQGERSGTAFYYTLVQSIEKCIQSCKRKRITVPPPMFQEKRFAEAYIS